MKKLISLIAGLFFAVNVHATSNDLTKIAIDYVKENYKKARERLGELSAEYQAFIDLLQVARAISCEEDPEGYQAAMAEARTQLVLVHEMAQDINTHYVNVIRPILLDLREQLSVLMEEENE